MQGDFLQRPVKHAFAQSFHTPKLNVECPASKQNRGRQGGLCFLCRADFHDSQLSLFFPIVRGGSVKFRPSISLRSSAVSVRCDRVWVKMRVIMPLDGHGRRTLKIYLEIICVSQET